MALGFLTLAKAARHEDKRSQLGDATCAPSWRRTVVRAPKEGSTPQTHARTHRLEVLLAGWREVSLGRVCDARPREETAYLVVDERRGKEGRGGRMRNWWRATELRERAMAAARGGCNGGVRHLNEALMAWHGAWRGLGQAQRGREGSAGRGKACGVA